MKKLLRCTIALFLLTSFLPQASVKASTSKTVTLTPSQDATILEGDATSFGAESTLTASRSGDDFKSFFLKFDLSAVSQSASIESATLTLHQTTASGSSISLNVYKVTSSWAEGSISGSSKPTFDTGVVYGSMTVDSNPGTKGFPQDFSGIVDSWLKNPTTNYGIYVESSSGEDYMHVFSSREGGSKPSLTVTYSVPDEDAPVISDVNATNIQSTSATVTWKTDEEASSYVEYGESESLGLVVGTDDLSIDHSVDIPALKGETKYFFKVKSKDKDENEAQSSLSSFTTLEDGESEEEKKDDESVSEEIAPPSNLKLSSGEENDSYYVELTWEHSSTEGVEGYRIYRSDGDKLSYKLITEVGYEKTSYRDEDVEEAQKYYYVLRTVIGDEESGDSNEEFVIVGGAGEEESTNGFWKGFLYFNIIVVPVFTIWYFVFRKKSRKGKGKNQKGMKFKRSSYRKPKK